MTDIVTDKYKALQTAKRRAFALLLLAAFVFIGTSVGQSYLSPDHTSQWLLRCLQTMAEAAMVGGLADWFAVSALFKRVPIPLLSRHTNIIPKNKDQIAKNLSEFIQDKFLEPAALTRRIEQKNPALMLAQWLLRPENGRQLSHLLSTFIQKILLLSNDKIIQQFLSQAVHTAIKRVDLSGSAAVILQTLTKEGRHQALLDQALHQFNHILSNEQTQTMIAEGIVDWLKDNHPLKEKVLPSALIGKKGALLAVATISHLVAEISENQEHHLRHEFDAFTRRLITRLSEDPVMAERGESVKDYLLNNATFNTYLNDVWHTFKRWLSQDIEQPDSTIQSHIADMSAWLGETLRDNQALQDTVNREIIQAAQDMLPQLGSMMSHHIQETVQHWDSQQLSEQIELNIGKDLQKIRINGTLLGACIGLILFIVSHLPSVIQLF